MQEQNAALLMPMSVSEGGSSDATDGVGNRDRVIWASNALCCLRHPKPTFA